MSREAHAQRNVTPKEPAETIGRVSLRRKTASTGRVRARRTPKRSGAKSRDRRRVQITDSGRQLLWEIPNRVTLARILGDARLSDLARRVYYLAAREEDISRDAEGAEMEDPMGQHIDWGIGGEEPRRDPG